MSHVPFALRLPTACRSFARSVALVPALLCSLAAPAQQPEEGYTASQHALAVAESLALATPAGLVTFDGTTVWLKPPASAPLALLQLPSTQFGSFLLQTDAAHVLFGLTGTQHALWHLPLAGPAPTAPLTLLGFNYDATLLDATTVLVSARTGGWSSPDNELWAVHLPTGAARLVASIPGASGPVAVGPNGDVYYATGFAGFPMPPGTTRVLRFPRPRVNAAIASGPQLTMLDAQAVVSGLDSASDLAFDDDGDLLFVDWFNARIQALRSATGPAPTPVTVVDYGGAPVSPTTVQFVAGTTSGVFEAFQPVNGALVVHETDYFSASRLQVLTAEPAILTATGGSPLAAGPFALAASEGPAAGLGLVAFAFGAAPGTTMLAVPGFDQPLWWSQALAGQPVVVPVSFDAAGTFTLPIVNPGFAPVVAATVQVAFLSTAGVLGASLPLVLQIGT